MDLEKRFGHDLNPLEDGSARRNRSSTLTIRGECASAPPRQSGVLNKSLGFGRPLSKAPGSLKSWHGQESIACRLPSRSPNVFCRGAILGKRAGGPNVAHPVTQTVSNPYLRLETGNGKLVAEKPHKPRACAGSLSSD